MCVHTAYLLHLPCQHVTLFPSCGPGYIPPKYCTRIREALDMYHGQPLQPPREWPLPPVKPCPVQHSAVPNVGNTTTAQTLGLCPKCHDRVVEAWLQSPTGQKWRRVKGPDWTGVERKPERVKRSPRHVAVQDLQESCRRSDLLLHSQNYFGKDDAFGADTPFLLEDFFKKEGFVVRSASAIPWTGPTLFEPASRKARANSDPAMKTPSWNLLGKEAEPNASSSDSKVEKSATGSKKKPLFQVYPAYYTSEVQPLSARELIRRSHVRGEISIASPIALATLRPSMFFPFQPGSPRTVGPNGPIILEDCADDGLMIDRRVLMHPASSRTTSARLGLAIREARGRNHEELQLIEHEHRLTVILPMPSYLEIEGYADDDPTT